tara:strand:- start:591 stop:1118 length:528 start_codon:yes stop_codon:yes gene_type:complete
VEQVGPYQVFKEIARGGQGAVLKARHVSRGTVVALKLLLSGDPSNYARFHREAETLARLRHPNLLGVDGYGQLPNGTPYLAMEFVQGRDLSDLGVICAQGNGVPEDQERAAEWFRRGAEAGHGQSMYFLAHRYLEGKGVPADRAQALKWFRGAAAARGPARYREAASAQLERLGG